MSEAPNASQKRFDQLAQRLAGGANADTPRRAGFGTGSLFVGRKMFGLLDDSGALVLKLSPARVQDLIVAGIGVGWHPGEGKPLQEYVAVGVSHQSKWLGLAKESRANMSSKR